MSHFRTPTVDFVIGGAAKCGTTALHAYLDGHPEIAMSYEKEPLFFTQEPGQFSDSYEVGDGPFRTGKYSRGFDWLEGLFTHKGAQCVRGESTTSYFVLEDTPRLLFEHNPKLKLVFMLREPVSRAISHYYEDLKSGLKLPPLDAMFDQNHPRLNWYLRGSSYEANLKRFLEYFPRESILVIDFEDFKNDAHGVTRRTLEFLGCDPNVHLPKTGEVVNPSAVPRFPWLQRIIQKIRVLGWSQKLPAFLKPLRTFVQWLFKKNLKATPYPPLRPDLKEQLRERFRPDVDYVEGWLGRKVAWRN